MSKRSLTRISCWFALAVVLAVPALAAKKDDLYKQAQAAANAGRVEEAARLYCDTAAEDPAYRDAKQLWQFVICDSARTPSEISAFVDDDNDELGERKRR